MGSKKAKPKQEDPPRSIAEIEPDRYMRVIISVNVNGHRAGDPITVERDNEFYSGLVRQGLAREVKS